MPATEIITKSIGQFANKNIHEFTGDKGNTYSTVNDWVLQKKNLGIQVKNVTGSVLVCNNNGLGWAAFEEQEGKNTLVTIFEIT